MSLYEEFKILGCAVEGYSSSHHGGSHRTDNYVMYGPRPVLKWKNGKWKNGENEKLRKSQGSSECSLAFLLLIGDCPLSDGNILHRRLRNRKDASRNDCLHLFMGDVQRVVSFHAREINGFVVDNCSFFTCSFNSELIVNVVYVDDQLVLGQRY